MAFTAGEVSALGFTTINNYLKNKPEKQADYNRPFLKKLRSGQKKTVAGKEFIVEQVKTQFGSNTQSVKGDTTVTYNKRDNERQASYAWTGYHDGLQMNEDFLAANGVTMTDDESQAKTATKAEVVQLVNLFTEQMSDLSDGFDEDLDLKYLQDGSAGADEIVGLDTLVSRTPDTGTVGGIDAATATYWRNRHEAGLTQANMVDKLETHYRLQTRYKATPDYIMAGGKAIDQFRNSAKAEIDRYSVLNTKGESAELDPSITGLHFHGIPILWNPSFDALDELLSPAAADEWSKRFYMLCMKKMSLRPIDGHDRIARRPPRESGNYIHRWAYTWKGALTMKQRNCQGVYVIA